MLLEDVLLSLDQIQVVGSKNPFKSNFLSGFSLTEQETQDIVAFLESLTDESFITDPRFSNPFE